MPRLKAKGTVAKQNILRMNAFKHGTVKGFLEKILICNKTFSYDQTRKAIELIEGLRFRLLL